MPPGERFGLDELAGLPDTQPQTPIWVWLIIPGALLVVISGFTWVRSKNQKLITERGITLTNILAERLDKGFSKIGLAPPRFLKNWIYLIHLPPQARAYQEINHALQRLGTQVALNQTPTERAERLCVLLPPANDAILILLNEYQALMYSVKPGNAIEAVNAARQIRNQSWYALLQRLLDRFIKTFRR